MLCAVASLVLVRWTSRRLRPRHLENAPRESRVARPIVWERHGAKSSRTRKHREVSIVGKSNALRLPFRLSC